MQFVYEAMRPDGTTVAERLEASGHSEAAEALREKGLLVLKLTEGRSAGGAAAGRQRRGRVNSRDLLLFMRQMKMLLESGAPVVPALEAAEQQTTKPAMQTVINTLRTRVEEGDTLSYAIEQHNRLFDPVVRGMIAAGEATASLPQVFGRLCQLMEAQSQTRRMVVGAMLYPAILSLLLLGVINILLLFVVPRFIALFVSLRSPLPATTKFLFMLSNILREDWPFVIGGLAAAITAAVFALRMPMTRRWFDGFTLGVPLIGPLRARLILARVVRVWAAMLRCHVPLLDAIRQSRDAVSNFAFLRMLQDVEEAVAAGGRMGASLGDAGLASPIIVSAIRTGEENGRLTEAIDFVSDWLDDDNANVIRNLTRLAEPLLLAFMGVIVGFVAMSLFIPLFDLATAA